MSLTPDISENSTAGGDTRGALIAAATEVFAEHGFREATVRDICARAHANVAAVNYHFGDKEALYAAVLVTLWNGQANPPQHLSLGAETAPEDRLSAYVRWFLQELMGESCDHPRGRIMAREMIEPTGALDRVVDGFIRPQSRWLNGVMAELLGPGFSDIDVELASMSVVGQILFYKHCTPVLERLAPHLIPTSHDIDRHALHITQFSLAAARGLRASRGLNQNKIYPGAHPDAVISSHVHS